MAEGTSTRSIASLLEVSSNTVKTHRKHILRRMGASSSIELAHMLLSHALTDDLPPAARLKPPAHEPPSFGEGPAREETDSQSRTVPDRDLMTGLLHVEMLRDTMDGKQRRPGGTVDGVLAQVRLQGLAELNQSHGRRVADALLTDVGSTVRRLLARRPGWFAARRAGPDFLLLAPGSSHPHSVATDLQHALNDALTVHGLQTLVSLPCAAARYSGSDTLRTVLTRLDAALQCSMQRGLSCVSVATPPMDVD